MKVVLTADVKGHGKNGEMVQVSDGYARNYLFPHKLAVEASPQALSELQNRANAARHKTEVELAAAQALAAKLEGQTVPVVARAGSEGRLFGSVTAKEVADALKQQLGVAVDRRKIAMQDIKSFGTFATEVRLHHGVLAHFFVLVRGA